MAFDLDGDYDYGCGHGYVRDYVRRDCCYGPRYGGWGGYGRYGGWGGYGWGPRWGGGYPGYYGGYGIGNYYY